MAASSLRRWTVLGALLLLCCLAQAASKINPRWLVRRFYKRADIKREMSEEKRLRMDLFKGYEYGIRPAPNATSPVMVLVKSSINELISYDYQNSELTLRGTFELKWNDPRLTWDPSNYSDIQNLVLSRHPVWTPDIMPVNVRETNLQEQLIHGRMRAYNDGSLYGRLQLKLSVPCMMAMRNFPHDEHTCELTVASVSLHGQELDFDVEIPDDMASLKSFKDTKSEFEVTKFTVDYSAEKYTCCPDLYPQLNYKISLRRRPAYYDHVFVLPAFLLLFLTPFVFLMPPRSGEKVTLGGFILLVTVLLLTMLDRFLPKGHFDVPIIVQYYSTILVLVTLSMGITTVVSNLGRGGQRRSRIPPIVKKVLLNFLSRFLFVYVEPEELYEKFENTNDPNHISDADNAAIISQEMTIGQTVVATENDEQILKCMRALVRRNVRIDAEDDIAYEWTLLSIILDRILFLFFMFVVILCNISILS